MTISVNSKKKQVKKTFDELINDLQTSNSEKVRYNAARILGEMGDSKAVEPLIDVLKNDKNGSVIEKLYDRIVGRYEDVGLAPRRMVSKALQDKKPVARTLVKLQIQNQGIREKLVDERDRVGRIVGRADKTHVRAVGTCVPDGGGGRFVVFDKENSQGFLHEAPPFRRSSGASYR